MIKYGTNPIAWSNDDDWSIGDHLSLEDCLTDCQNIGFDGIEKGHKMPEDGPVLKAKLAEYDLQFIGGWHSTHLLTNDLETEKARLKDWIDFVRGAGGERVIACECSNAVHSDPKTPINNRPTLSEAEWDSFTKAYDELAAFARDEGTVMAYHHHMGTIIESPEDIDRFMAMTSPETKLLFDTGHAYFGGGNPAEQLKKHVDRVAHLHCKNIRKPIMDQVRADDLSFLEGVIKGAFTVPGDEDGCIDFEPVLQVAADAGYQGWVVIEAEQDSAVYDPNKYQSLGLKTLKSIADKVGLA